MRELVLRFTRSIDEVCCYPCLPSHILIEKISFCGVSLTSRCDNCGGDHGVTPRLKPGTYRGLYEGKWYCFDVQKKERWQLAKGRGATMWRPKIKIKGIRGELKC